MTILQFQVRSGKLCNTFSKSDRHDTSLEIFMKESPDGVFLIEKRGSRMMCFAGSLVVPEKVEAPEPPDPRPVQKAETAKSRFGLKPKGKRGK